MVLKRRYQCRDDMWQDFEGKLTCLVQAESPQWYLSWFQIVVTVNSMCCLGIDLVVFLCDIQAIGASEEQVDVFEDLWCDVFLRTGKPLLGMSMPKASKSKFQ